MSSRSLANRTHCGTLTCSTVTSTRSVQIRTDGAPLLKASVLALWGPKSLENVVPLDLHLKVEIERSSVLRKRGVLQDGCV